MGLIKCLECENEISSKAMKCPQCGAPVPISEELGKVGQVGCSVLLVIFILALAIVIFETRTEDSRIQMTAFKACEKEIISNSKFPSEVDVHYWTDSEVWKSPVKKSGEWSLTVKGGADLMNGFGNMIPHRYYCKVLGNEVTDLEIAPG